MKVNVLTKALASSTDDGATTFETAALESKQIDWKDSSDRKWLMSHFHWAVNNRHCVLIRPIFLNPLEGNPND